MKLAVITKRIGLLVYSVTIVLRAANGLLTKLTRANAWPLTSTGKRY